MNAIAKPQRLPRLSVAEAKSLTAKAVEAWSDAEAWRFTAAKLILTCIRKRVPETLGMSLTAWAQEYFTVGEKKIGRLLKISRGVAELPDKVAEQIVKRESTAYDFSRLPAEDRVKESWQRKAVEQKAEDFRAAVKHRLCPNGAKLEEEWLAFSVSLPADIFHSLVEAEKRCAEALDFDMTDESKAAGHRVAIWERIAHLINETGEQNLRELLGSSEIPQ